LALFRSSSGSEIWLYSELVQDDLTRDHEVAIKRFQPLLAAFYQTLQTLDLLD
jgi:hypothetical protein